MADNKSVIKALLIVLIGLFILQIYSLFLKQQKDYLKTSKSHRLIM